MEQLGLSLPAAAGGFDSAAAGMSAEQALYSADWLVNSDTHESVAELNKLDNQLDLYPELNNQDQSIEYQNKIDIMKRSMNLKCKGTNALSY